MSKVGMRPKSLGVSCLSVGTKAKLHGMRASSGVQRVVTSAMVLATLSGPNLPVLTITICIGMFHVFVQLYVK